jgi:hypothetical protein
MRFRSLVWLVALLGFILPPAVAPAAALQPSGHAMMSDCPDHAPPPAPCPDKDTAKHAAGLCCPFMSLVVAVLPSMAADADGRRFDDRIPALVRDLTGLSPHKDPPPPRV